MGVVPLLAASLRLLLLLHAATQAHARVHVAEEGVHHLLLEGLGFFLLDGFAEHCRCCVYL